MAKKIKNIEEHIFHIWLDELEVYGTFKEEDFIDCDGWPKDVKIINWFYIKRNRVTNYKYKISFYLDKEDHKLRRNKLFSYYKWSDIWNIPTKDYIVVHWTWFRVLSEDRILYFLEQFHLWKTRRFDIALDLDIDIKIVLNQFKKISQKWATFYWPEWNIQTQYIWEKQNTKNKRSLIRIYDKIADIKEKQKNELYQEYLLNDYITRIELEIRPELAQNIYYLDLFNIHTILSIFRKYIWRQTDLFDKMEWEKKTLYVKKYEKIDPELYQSTYYRDKRKNTFLWHAKLIYNLWYCPIRVLIAEDLIKDKTKKAIWIESILDLAQKERKVKELSKEDKYIRENLEEILSNYYKYGSKR